MTHPRCQHHTGQGRRQDNGTPHHHLPSGRVCHTGPQQESGGRIGGRKGKAEALRCAQRSREGPCLSRHQREGQHPDEDEDDQADAAAVPRGRPHSPDQRGRRQQDHYEGRRPFREGPVPKPSAEQRSRHRDPRSHRRRCDGERQTDLALLCCEHPDSERCSSQGQQERTVDAAAPSRVEPSGEPNVHARNGNAEDREQNPRHVNGKRYRHLRQ